jgi:hypothetical protein
MLALPALAADECTYDFMTCGSSWAELLEHATCQFIDSSQRYFTWYIDLGAGTQFDMTVTSDAFPPLILLYRGDDVEPMTGASGNKTAHLTTNIIHSDTYWIVVTSNDPAKKKGLFEMHINCTVDCQQPVISSPVQQLSVPYGDQVRINIEVDGSPLLKFRWFDEANPTVTLAETYKTFITDPMTHDTTFGVRAYNDCGADVKTAAIVTVQPCTQPSITVQPTNAVVAPGGTATFTLQATGTEPLTTMWYEGAPPDRTKYLGFGTTLTMPNATRSMPVWARVTNACGEAASNQVTLAIGSGRKRAVRH